MILNRLALVNFGVYRGKHEFDLRPEVAKPIIILGGKNGTGKTTLLEAMQLCLYGPLAFEESMSQLTNRSEYEHQLSGRIHKNPNGALSPDWASVELEFAYSIAGERQTYTVERAWTEKNGHVEETLRVLQDYQLMQQMDISQWKDFVQELVPPGISQLVFFDGEKVQSLATGSRTSRNIALSQAIKSLFGFDFIEQLHSDLTTYRRRQQRGNQVDAVEQRIESLIDQREQTRSESRDQSQQLEAIESQLRTLKSKVESQEQEIQRAGGDFAARRAEYKTTQGHLQNEIEAVQAAIRDLSAGLLPIAITPLYTTAVKTQLVREATYEQWLASKAFIEQKLASIQSRIGTSEFWQDTGAELLVDLQRTIGERVGEVLQSMVEPPEEMREVIIRHRVSEPERQQMLRWIDESLTTIPEQLRQLTSRLVQLRQELEQAESALRQVPADDVLGPLMSALNACNQEYGALDQQRRQKEETRHRLELRLKELERDLRKARDERKSRQKLAEKIQRVTDVQLVLDDFGARLLQSRTSQLEEAFVSCFNQLCRKNHLIQQAKIDPQDFSVALIGVGREAISQSRLSAGEKEIYAIALLWALRQVSGRPLPIVIDAPLGRLDSDHRRNLVERYFPQASHQVILFSTDTEVDANFYASLQNIISRAYHLDYDQSQKTTLVKQGYFWQTNGRKAK